jgi:hypothetical protein
MIACHSGKFGDTICAMCAFKAMGGGDLVFQQRYPFFDVKGLETSLGEILLQQPYVHSARTIGNQGILNIPEWHHIDVDLNVWWLDRLRKGELKPDGSWNLASLVLDKFGLPHSHLYEPWISIEAKSIAKYVIAKNTQATCRNIAMPWSEIVQKIGHEAVFLGLPTEHARFCALYGHVPYYKTQTLAEAAKIICGAQCFVGNQSALNALAESMGKRQLLEVSPDYPGVIFRRPGAFFAWAKSPKGWESPDLEEVFDS